MSPEPVRERCRRLVLDAVVRAGKPVTAKDVGTLTGLTDGAALTFLTEHTGAGILARQPAPGIGPLLEHYAIPALLADLDRSPTMTTRTPVPAALPVAPADEPAPLPPDRRAPARGRGSIGTARRDILVQAALAYAERGWHVFPLRPDDKRPAFPGHLETTCTRSDPRCARAGRHVTWEGRATTDPARIRAAWTRTPYGIGIATGPSGLVVIDLDTPKPDSNGTLPTPPPEWDHPGIHDGIDVFDELCAAHGPFRMWDTYGVHTGRNGLHLYFTHPTTGPQLRNTQGDLGWLIDTRAHGGYVVAPPSTAVGLPYEADDHTATVLPLPDWLGEILSPAPLPLQEPVTVRLSAGGGRRERYLQAALDQCVAAVHGSEATKHNKALYGAAVQLGQLVAGGELTEADVIAALLPAGISVGQSEAQARKTIASGLKAGAHRSRTITTVGAAA